MSRRNPVPREVVVAGVVAGVLIGGALVFRATRRALPAGGKSWKQLTSPAFKAGGVYRVTMDPVGGKTSDDEAAEIAARVADPAVGGVVTVLDAPYLAPWMDTDPARWHFEVIATKAYDASAVSGIRAWEWG